MTKLLLDDKTDRWEFAQFSGWLSSLALPCSPRSRWLSPSSSSSLHSCHGCNHHHHDDHQGITVLAVCVVHEVVVAQKLGPRDWFALAEASLAGEMMIIQVMMKIIMEMMINAVMTILMEMMMTLSPKVSLFCLKLSSSSSPFPPSSFSGKSTLPDWVKLSAQRFVLLGLTGVALMLARQESLLKKTILKLIFTLIPDCTSWVRPCRCSPGLTTRRPWRRARPSSWHSTTWSPSTGGSYLHLV